MIGWWGIRARLGRLEDAVRDLHAAVARFEATDVARTAAALDASTRLERTAERIRKQADRSAPPAGDSEDDFYERLAAARGYMVPEREG
jgi:hypothetical protein